MDSKMITKVTGRALVDAFLCVAPASLLCGAGVLGTSVKSGLSLDWASADAGRGMRAMHDARPTRAPKAAVAAAKHGDYAHVIGAGATQQQNEQQINLAEAAFTGAEAVRIRAFRGPDPWRERT